VLSLRARTWQRKLPGVARLLVGNLKRNKKAPPVGGLFATSAKKLPVRQKKQIKKFTQF
jgi:hypothetical protein